jgi:methyltransferase (TIGR00027 family)
VVNVVPVQSSAATRPAGQHRHSQTAEIVCAQRAAETLRGGAARQIVDPYAKHFITKGLYRALVATRPTAALTRAGFDRLYPGYMAVVLLRNRKWEDLVAAAVAEGIEQIVLLGAGYDTTALRLPLGAATVFEVDAPPTQQVKRDVCARHGIDDAHVRYAPCDFERDSLPSSLVAAGFDPAKRSLVAWWGVSFFLTPDAVRQTLADVASLTAPGSRLVFDYLDSSVIDGTTAYRGARKARAAVEKRGEGYKFGLSGADARWLVASHGFEVESNESITDLARSYPSFDYSTDDFFGIITGRRA